MECNRLEIKIIGKSMAPLIDDGDIAVINLSDSNFLAGDILLFKDNETKEFTIHRLISLENFQTKGDNSNFIDSKEKQILGKVVEIKKRNDLFIKINNTNLSKTIAKLSLISTKNIIPRFIFRYLIRYVLNLYITHKKSYFSE